MKKPLMPPEAGMMKLLRLPEAGMKTPLMPPEAGMKTPEVGVNFRTLTATEMHCGRIRDALMAVWRLVETGRRSGDLNGPDEDDASFPRFPKTRSVS
jgi:hypothetical protein